MNLYFYICLFVCVCIGLYFTSLQGYTPNVNTGTADRGTVMVPKNVIERDLSPVAEKQPETFLFH